MTTLSSLFAQGGTSVVVSRSYLTDKAVSRGDGGERGLQTSSVLISDAGEMTNPSQPCFSLELMSELSNATGDGTVVNLTGAVWTEVFDVGSNVSDGTFTAPVSGKYILSGLVAMKDFINTHTSVHIKVVTSNRDYSVYFTSDIFTSTAHRFNFSVIADMDTSDTAYVSVSVSGSTKVIDVESPHTKFFGVLIC